MAQKASSLDAVMKALPAVQAAVREEIAARIAAGEDIARVEGDRIISRNAPRGDLNERRRELLERHAAKQTGRGRSRRKSVA